MRMVLASFGIKKSEKQLAKQLETNKIKGTWHKYLPELSEKYKFDYIVKRNGKISDLRAYSKKGWKIIICFIYKNEPHYSVVKKINWHSIYLLNPYSSPNERYFIPHFKRHWKDSEDKRWFVAIKKA